MIESLDALGIMRKTDKASTDHNYLVHYEYFLVVPTLSSLFLITHYIRLELVCIHPPSISSDKLNEVLSRSVSGGRLKNNTDCPFVQTFLVEVLFCIVGIHIDFALSPNETARR